MRDVFVLHGEYGPGVAYGCTHVRLLRPLSHPSVATQVRLTHGTTLPDRTNPDVVILERLPHAPRAQSLSESERLVDELENRGVPLLYETDDSLLDLGVDRPWELPARTEVHAASCLLARRSAGLLLTTSALAERMRHLNRNLAVVPNALDERLFGGAADLKPANDPLVVGYMGTRTHDEDLRMVLRPLRDLLARAGGRIRLEIVGIAPEASLDAYFEGLPVTRWEPGIDERYPLFPAWMRRTLAWDFAIAPLEDDPFTRCKSDLKYLDYAALGIPAIFSDVRPYRETVRDRETGLIARNEPDVWAAALEEMASNASLRTRLAGAARDEVHRTRMLATNARVWVEAIDNLLGSAGGRRALEPPRPAFSPGA